MQQRCDDGGFRRVREKPMPFRRAAIAGLALFAGGTPLLAGPLAAHRAVYDLTLDRASERSGVTGLSGRMVYEFNGSPCEGYTVNFRFVTRIATEDTQRLTDQQTTTYEDGEGKTFRFVTKSFVDQALDKEVRGKAERDGDSLRVALEKPEAEKIDLETTLFPTGHMIDMIGRAAKGETFYETTIFDGSEDADRVMTTTVVLGRKADSAADDPEAKAFGQAAPASFWPVTIAYFDPQGEGGGEIPTYRIAFKLQEDGVTRDLLMDYGDFAMRGKLVEFAPMKPQACPN